MHETCMKPAAQTLDFMLSYTPPSRKPPEQVKLLPYGHQTKLISNFTSMVDTKLHLLQTEQQNSLSSHDEKFQVIFGQAVI